MSVNQIDVNAVNRRTRRTYELECTHCGEIVERQQDIEKPSCFTCKVKRQKAYGAKVRKAAKEHDILIRSAKGLTNNK